MSVGQVGKGKREEPDSSKMCSSPNTELERLLEQKSLIALFFCYEMLLHSFSFPPRLSQHLQKFPDKYKPY